MRKKHLSSTQEKEAFFCSEFVRMGVPYQRAVIVAQILATNKPDDLLTADEIELSKTVCKQWLEQRHRLHSLFHSPHS